MKASLLFLSFTICSAHVSSHPAKDLVAQMRKKIPADPVQWIQETLAKAPKSEAGTPRILVIGDSWADVVGAGGSFGVSFLDKTLKKHGCTFTSSCIAIPGTETDDWASGALLAGLKLAAREADYVFTILVGNDALDKMPDCASQKKSAAECGDEMMAEAMKNMHTIVEAVNEVNPKARVVGFGYDTMFGGFGCGLVTHDIFPQCWGKGVPTGGGNRCFNTQFLRIQQMWDNLAGNISFVDSASILGATQVAGGDDKASTDPKSRHIDMDKMGPAKYWPNYEGCFHPGVVGGADSGAMVVMEEFFKVYWSKKLTCSGEANAVVV